MGISIRIIDEQFGKTKTPIFDLIYAQETITAREFITRRVEEEIAQIQEKQKDPQRIKAQHRMFLAGLTKTSPEVFLNNSPKSFHRIKAIDVNRAIKTALSAFRAGHYFLLFNDKQVENLDDLLILRPESEAIFVQLTPLIGG
jgi:hypothetical protein